MSDIKKTVTFTESVEVLDHIGDLAFEAQAGETMDLAAASANRWIRRGKAVEGEQNWKDLPAKVEVTQELVDADPAETLKKQAPITATEAPAPKKKRAPAKKKAAPEKQAD